MSMARLLNHAAKEAGYADGADIYSYELSTRVPLACVAREIIVGLRWADPDILNDIKRVVEEKSIDIIIPFVDPAVGVAARFGAMCPSMTFIPADNKADDMFDKLKSDRLFREASLPVPPAYTPDEVTVDDLPLIAKPRRGSASKGIKVIDSLEELRAIAPDAESYLIQKYYPDCTEYTVDCYVTCQGEPYTSPRIRLETAGGEVVRTITVDDPSVSGMAKELLKATGLKGAVTVQMLRDNSTGRLMIMEVNPRLGGGAVCSVHAGFDLPGAIISEFEGKEVKPMKAQPKVEMTRYFEEVIFKDNQ